MNSLVGGLVLVLLFVAVLYYYQKGGELRLSKQLENVLNRGGILARADGEIAGIALGIETYEDGELGIERKRLRYFDMDEKEKKVEPMDGFNPKRGELIETTKVKPNGKSGLYLSEFTNPKTGDRIPIEKGKRIQRLREEADNIQAVRKEVNEMSDEYRSMKRRLNQLEKENSRVRNERNEMEDELNDYAEAANRFRKLAKSYRARVQSEEARSQMLSSGMQRIAEANESVEEEVMEILERAKNRFEEGRDMGAIPDMPGGKMVNEEIIEEGGSEAGGESAPAAPEEEQAQQAQQGEE